jgi:hypothetical protein
MGRARSKALLNSLPSLSLSALRKAGAFRHRGSNHFTWRWDGPATALCRKITVQAEAVLVEGCEPVFLARRAAAIGGCRTYLLCAGCGRLAEALFLQSVAFRCRRCAKLVYPSQRENRIRRASRAVSTLRARLRATSTSGLPPRPRGMHHGKYLALAERLVAAKVEHRRLIKLKWGPIVAALEKRISKITPLQDRGGETEGPSSSSFPDKGEGEGF